MQTISNAQPIVADIANISDFHEFLRLGTDQELAAVAVHLQSKIQAKGTLRDAFTDMLKERLHTVRQVLKVC